MRKTELLHGLVFSILSVSFLFFLHHLPINQIFIDPFSEAIKSQDVMDISISKFRNHKDPSLFDNQVFIINSQVTDREEIAKTVKFLKEHEVGAVGIDLVFDSLHNDYKDTLLAEALDGDNIVLGYSFLEKIKREEDSEKDLESHPYFTKNVNQAFVNLASNDGFSVRAFEPFHSVEGNNEESFSLKLVSKIDSTIVEETKSRNHGKEWINFRRIQPGVNNMEYPVNSDKLTHYAYTGIKTFLKDTASYEKGYFKNKIVLIGFCGENDKAFSMKDRYFTPMNEKYQGRSIPDMHGVVVHANIISMLNHRDFIHDVSEKYLYLIAFFLFFINYFIFSKIARKKLFLMMPIVRIIQIIQFIILLTGCIMFFSIGNIKFGFILIITAVILSFELFEFYAHKLRNRIAQKINILAVN
jgi:CHASE2 domain-containing sensor protein